MAWGAYRGVFLVLERLFLLRVYRRLGPLSILPTFAITVVGWVLFRAETLAGALAYAGRMLGQTPPVPDVGWGGPAVAAPVVPASWQQFDAQFWTLLALGALFAFMNVVPGLERRNLSLYAAHTLSWRRSVALAAVSAALLLVSTSSLVSSSFNPFIYFRF
ncbi:MBOAT family O-acyltransferase [Hymenobacter polaris]|uniref:hypothetical protein n=1 Tax=Hymenobacter polaris TaxID=2682546 RepID=UPI0019D601A8|nr:hypothetical protein [Hymenobacter polaris]